MSRERELLERAYQYIPLSSITSQEIRTFLADTNPSETINSQEVDRSEPVAYLYDLDAYCDHRPEQDVLARKIPKGIPSEYLKNVRPLFLHPSPRQEFVRLSEEEVREIEASIPPKMDLAEAKKKFAQAIEDALEEKNK